jgi:hypothetical protein
LKKGKKTKKLLKQLDRRKKMVLETTREFAMISPMTKKKMDKIRRSGSGGGDRRVAVALAERARVVVRVVPAVAEVVVAE